MSHPDEYDNPILLLRIGIVVLIIIIVIGVIFYGIHYIRLAIDRFSAAPTPETVNPYVTYQLVIRVRVGETRDPAIGTQISIDEYGQPVGRNLVSTTVTSNAAGTAIAELPAGQYTIRPAQSDAWSGLTTVNLTSTREITLLIDPARQ